MTQFAPLLEAYFADRLTRQRDASPHTIASYRDTFCLLLRFVNEETGKAPSRLDLGDLDASVIGAFLDHLERARGCSAATRNVRLAALRSFFAYAALSCPEHANLISRVLAIPAKRSEHTPVSYLDEPEVDALVRAPDLSTWIGRRDHCLLVVGFGTGFRVSELTRLRREDVTLGSGAHLWCHGKGRKQRCVPIGKSSAAVLAAWMKECEVFCRFRGSIQSDWVASPMAPLASTERLNPGRSERSDVPCHRRGSPRQAPARAVKGQAKRRARTRSEAESRSDPLQPGPEPAHP